jgi:mono/diheme cytochrome c family protein
VVDRSLVTVPFAVPVGIPVAAAQSFSYRYDYRPPTAYRYGALTQEELADRVAEKVIERFSQIEHLQAIGFRASAVTTHCSACHKGSGAKGGFRLSGRLSPQQSYRALQQIVSGAMPKERHISAEERSELIHELLNLEVEPRRMSIEEVVPAAPTP